jgi:hypothetical protein
MAAQESLFDLNHFELPRTLRETFLASTVLTAALKTGP